MLELLIQIRQEGECHSSSKSVFPIEATFIPIFQSPIPINTLFQYPLTCILFTITSCVREIHVRSTTHHPLSNHVTTLFSLYIINTHCLFPHTHLIPIFQPPHLPISNTMLPSPMPPVSKNTNPFPLSLSLLALYSTPIPPMYGHPCFSHLSTTPIATTYSSISPPFLITTPISYLHA